jgi:hypothetical protein
VYEKDKSQYDNYYDQERELNEDENKDENIQVELERQSNYHDD